MRRELAFLLALWKANLSSAVEYRAAFFSQVVGMMLNNAVYFLFWVLFFDRFKAVRGWGLNDMFLLFGIAAAGLGLAVFLFGNVLTLSDLIAGGRMDYYLSLPRPALLHALAGRGIVSGLGDVLYGVISVSLAGNWGLDTAGRFVLGTLFSATIFLAFHVLVQSLAFWMGNVSGLAAQATNALLTFSIYPITLFDGTAKLLLFTLIPAAFIGAVPAAFVRAFSWATLLELAAAALGFVSLAGFVFHRGLRRYESGSAIQVEV